METAASLYSTNYRTVTTKTRKSRKSVFTRSKSFTLYIDKIKMTPLHASVTLHINKMDSMCHLEKEYLLNEAD
jgi:hypothetical protein